MGTRAIIKIDGFEELVYKQYDGYPGCLGEMLRELTSDDLKSPATIKNALDRMQIKEHLADGMLGRDGEPLPYFSDIYIQREDADDAEWIYYFNEYGELHEVIENTPDES